MVAAAVLVLLVPRVWSQLLALLLGGLVGLCALTPPELPEPSAPERLVVPLRRSVSVVLLGFAVLLFVAMPWLSAEARPLLVQQLSGFLRTGALVSRWWSCGAPLAGTSLGTQRLDRPAAVSRGVWRSPGRARADVHGSRGFLGFDMQPGLHNIAGSVLALVALFFSTFITVLVGWWALARSGVTWAVWLRCVEPCGHQLLTSGGHPAGGVVSARCQTVHTRGWC